jgi:hypothetical protein
VAKPTVVTRSEKRRSTSGPEDGFQIAGSMVRTLPSAAGSLARNPTRSPYASNDRLAIHSE